ncbi:cysteine-tryptophan domain-containing zinc finger protein 7 isoform X2 [Euphorbia lathyris]|uniref:cysteine-tryptophan domain-containing zinc finger protein 7 isoform X2 n=1 Tax=Euphorbia lathyris TaxID=212925 RepID=UPI003313B9EC
MTSFPVPGGALISPLQENLLCLKEKKIFSRNVKPVPFLKRGQTSSTLLAKESVSLVGKLSKKSKAHAPSSNASGNKEDLPRGSLAPSKHKVVQQAAFCVQDKFLTSSAKERALSQGKKLHRSKSSKNAAGNSLASEVAPPAPNPNPGLILDHWVCCDSCQKWRLLPYDTLPEHLPKKWLCSMLNWLPGKNRCDISEEETTKALIDEGETTKALDAVYQKRMQNDTSRTTSGVHVQHVNHTLQSLNSLAGPTQAKKKHGLKEIAKEGISSGMMRSSNSLNNHLQESVKSRSRNNMNQPPAEANLVNKSRFYTLSKSQNLVAEVKRNPLGEGNTKLVKMKNKREAEHYGSGNPKKIKIDLSDKHILKSTECSSSRDVRCDAKERLPVPVKNLCNQSQISSSLNVKKRKLIEWQGDQNGLDSTATGNNSRGKLIKKEEVVKKLKVSSWGSQDHAVDGVNAERRIHKDQPLQKNRGNFTSQQHLGLAQLSMRATSSSSKEGEVDLRSRAPPPKRINNVKHNIPDKPSNKFCKDVKVHVNRTNSGQQKAGYGSSGEPGPRL